MTDKPQWMIEAEEAVESIVSELRNDPMTGDALLARKALRAFFRRVPLAEDYGNEAREQVHEFFGNHETLKALKETYDR
jgi:hypothetical protein